MKRNSVNFAAALLLVITVEARADIVTIDFEGFSGGTTFSSGSEDGFDLLVTTPFPASIFNDGSLLFAPLSGNFLASNTNTNLDTVLSMTETDGSTFRFLSLDGRWSASQTAQTITVEGFRSGALVGSDLFDVAANNNAATYFARNLAGITVDELRFTLTGRSSTPGPRQETWVDNIVVNSVPEPGSLFVISLFAFAFGWRRCRGFRVRG